MGVTPKYGRDDARYHRRLLGDVKATPMPPRFTHVISPDISRKEGYRMFWYDVESKESWSEYVVIRHRSIVIVP